MDISYSSFFFFGRVIALLPVDFGKEIWNFILQITGRVVLKECKLCRCQNGLQER